MGPTEEGRVFFSDDVRIRSDLGLSVIGSSFLLSLSDDKMRSDLGLSVFSDLGLMGPRDVDRSRRLGDRLPPRVRPRAAPASTGPTEGDRCSLTLRVSNLPRDDDRC